MTPLEPGNRDLSRLWTSQVAISTAAIACAVALQWALRRSVTEFAPFPLLLIAAGLIAWRFGLRAGIGATAVAGLLTAFVFLPPIYSLRVDAVSDRWKLVSFTVEAAGLSCICAAHSAVRRERDELLRKERAAREEAATLSRTLAAMRRGHRRERADWEQLARVLAGDIGQLDSQLSADLAALAFEVHEYPAAIEAHTGPVLDEVVKLLRERSGRAIDLVRDDLPTVAACPSALRRLFLCLLEIPVQDAGSTPLRLSVSRGQMPDAWILSLDIDPPSRRSSRASVRLIMCRRIVEQLGGRIWEAGMLTGGARFVFSLPRSSH
jgi:K+-sensing histidine kinase KdpD